MFLKLIRVFDFLKNFEIVKNTNDVISNSNVQNPGFCAGQ